MKQTSFIVKDPGGNHPEKESTITKRSFRSSIKPLSLNSTIPIDELTTITFYCFRISKLFNIRMPPFLHGSQYMTNQWYTTPSTWLTHQLEEYVGCKVLHFINNEDQETLGYKTIKCKDTVASFRENKTLNHFLHVFSLFFICDGLQNKPYTYISAWDENQIWKFWFRKSW